VNVALNALDEIPQNYKISTNSTINRDSFFFKSYDIKMFLLINYIFKYYFNFNVMRARTL
jgi:hypothetical protein